MPCGQCLGDVIGLFIGIRFPSESIAHCPNVVYSTVVCLEEHPNFILIQELKKVIHRRFNGVYEHSPDDLEFVGLQFQMVALDHNVGSRDATIVNE